MGSHPTRLLGPKPLGVLKKRAIGFPLKRRPKFGFGIKGKFTPKILSPPKP